MAHNHDHSHHHHAPEGEGRIKTAFFLNLFFTLAELVGGFFTNSLAIMSDALHDLGDSLSLGIAWYLSKLAKKEEDKNFSFGYKRFSLLGALINSVVLIIGSFIILSEAVPRIFNPEPAHAQGMFIFAIAGIIINGAAALKLRGGKSLNERVVSWHMIEDVLGWAAVLIVSIALMFSDLYVLDPLLSLIITLYVLFNVIRNLKETLKIFLQGTPEEVDIDDIEKRILSIDGAESVHHLHVWSLDGELHILTAHVVSKGVRNINEAIQLKRKIRAALNDTHIEHVTMELEFEGENCCMEHMRH